MKKLIFSLAMLGFIYSADAQCKCQGQKKKAKSKTASVAKKKAATGKTVATKAPSGTATISVSDIGLTQRYVDTMQGIPIGNSIKVQEVQPWAGFTDDFHETGIGTIAVPLPEYRDIATEENMEMRGDGQIPHRNINMRGTNPTKNSFEQDLEILNRYDKMRGKQTR